MNTIDLQMKALIKANVEQHQTLMTAYRRHREWLDRTGSQDATERGKLTYLRGQMSILGEDCRALHLVRGCLRGMPYIRMENPRTPYPEARLKACAMRLLFLPKPPDFAAWLKEGDLARAALLQAAQAPPGS